MSLVSKGLAGTLTERKLTGPWRRVGIIVSRFFLMLASPFVDLVRSFGSGAARDRQAWPVRGGGGYLTGGKLAGPWRRRNYRFRNLIHHRWIFRRKMCYNVHRLTLKGIAFQELVLLARGSRPLARD